MIAAHDFYENEFARFWMANGILFFEYKPETIINLEVAKSVVADRIFFQKEKAYPICCDVRGVIDTEKAGRDYLAKFGSLLTKAVGLLADEEVTLTISNFYLQVNKPVVPTQIFTKKEEALLFLKGYL
ncbi:hypothetical protein [Flavobacterium succinicans]|uniref:DUF7793 domain-containing protein n=1 Tax=Flavobacterium succinicans TaxID=29536 RepID=A0A199XV06_9FLAO|nr:hypothetical protein [Flavobacterium succinicans]OAZ05247.1 hypothetical protein FLB_03380 [Flavobacterium succinicans]